MMPDREKPSMTSFTSLFGLVCIFGNFAPIGSRSQGGSYGGCETSVDSPYALAEIFGHKTRDHVSYSCVTCQIGAREVHVLSVFSSANRGIWWTGDRHTGYVEVRVSPTESTTPVLLVLTSEDVVIWKIMQLTSQIKEILVIQGYESEVKFMGNATPVSVTRVRGLVGYGSETNEIRKLMSTLHPYTSFITSLTGTYEADSFTLTPSGHQCTNVTLVTEGNLQAGEEITPKPQLIGEHSYAGCDIDVDSSEALAEPFGYVRQGYKLYSCVTCQLDSLTVSEATEVNVLSVYASANRGDWRAGENPGSIKVKVMFSKQPRKMFLVLTSYDPITWRLEGISRHVEDILLISYQAKARVEFLGSHGIVEVKYEEGWVGYGSKREELEELMAKLEPYTSYITSLTGVYEAESFTLNSSGSACSGNWHLPHTENGMEKPTAETAEEEGPTAEVTEEDKLDKWNESLFIVIGLCVHLICCILIGIYCVHKYAKKRRDSNEVNRQRAAPSTIVREPPVPSGEQNVSNSYTTEAEQPTAPQSEYIELQHPTVPLDDDQELRRPLAPQNDDLPPSYEDYDKYPIPQHRQGPPHAPQAPQGASIAPYERPAYQQTLPAPPEYQSLNHGSRR